MKTNVMELPPISRHATPTRRRTVVLPHTQTYPALFLSDRPFSPPAANIATNTSGQSGGLAQTGESAAPSRPAIPQVLWPLIVTTMGIVGLLAFPFVLVFMTAKALEYARRKLLSLAPESMPSLADSFAPARNYLLILLLMLSPAILRAVDSSSTFPSLDGTRAIPRQTKIPGVRAPDFPPPIPKQRPARPPTNGIASTPAVALTSNLHKEIGLTDTGAQAAWGRTKVYFPTALDSPIRVTTPDGRHLSFRPTFLVLENRATGETVLLGTVTNRSPGTIYQPNTVTWSNIFNAGPRASLEIIYDGVKGSIEQNLHLDEALTDLPAGWDQADTVLECWTEWWTGSAGVPPASSGIQSAGLATQTEGPPTIQSRTVTLREESELGPAVQSTDDTISFGVSRITAGGKAFTIGNDLDSPALPVAKSWVQIPPDRPTAPARQFLIETLDYLAAKPQLDALPKPEKQASLRAPKKGRSQFLQASAAENADKSGLSALSASTKSKSSTPPSEAGDRRPVNRRMTIANATHSDHQLSTINHQPPFQALNQQSSLLIDFTLLEAIPLPSGAISWWPAGGNSLDALTNHNDGTPYNDPSYTAGEVGQGFSLPGPSDNGAHFRVEDRSSLHVSNAVTIEAWVNPATVDSFWFSSIVDKWDLTGPSPQESYGLALAPDQTAYIVVSSSGDESGSYFVVTTNIVPFDTWTHVAGVYDGSALKVYLNGDLKVAGAYTNGIFPGTNVMGIGALLGGGSPGDSGSTFQGAIDEPTIYNRGLSASEIQSIYNAGPAGKYNPNCVPPSTNAVGWWPGDGNAYDIAHTNMGTLMNGATFASGVVGQGFSLDGSDDYVLITNNADLNPTNQLTIETWVYLNDYSEVDPDSDTPFYNNSAIVRKDGECGDRQYMLTASPYGSFRAHVGIDGGGYNYIDSATVPENQTWYHVAETYDGTNLSIYVNGVLDASTSVSGSIITTTQPVTIGGSDNGCWDYFVNGIIDEPTIYNRALSADEIAAIYAAGCAGKCKVDSDGDGLTDLQEAFLGTDPNNPDTDSDSVPDGVEFFQGRNPLISGSTNDVSNLINLQVYTPLK